MSRPEADTQPQPAVPSSDAPGEAPPDSAPPGSSSDGTAALSPFPPYLQSLLQIQVPLSVTLASKRQPLQRILELGPGSILPFDKPCSEPLTLDVAGETIAQGEVIKVGDKFGLRLTFVGAPQCACGPLSAGERRAVRRTCVVTR